VTSSQSAAAESLLVTIAECEANEPFEADDPVGPAAQGPHARLISQRIILV